MLDIDVLDAVRRATDPYGPNGEQTGARAPSAAEVVTRLDKLGFAVSRKELTTPPLTGSECGDIAITAAEGGIGHWATIERYDWPRWTESDGTPGTVGDSKEVADDFVFYTIEYENPYDNDPPRLTADVTPVTIRRGFVRALDMARDDLVRRVLGLPREDWMGEIDADGADVIVQCGVLGDVVFG
jgi:hypothetical protein